MAITWVGSEESYGVALGVPYFWEVLWVTMKDYFLYKEGHKSQYPVIF